MSNEWKSNTLGVISIVLSLLALINEQYRIAVIVTIGIALTFYIINSLSEKIDGYDEKIKRLEKKLKIYQIIIDLKADVEKIKKEVLKNDSNK